MSRNRRQRLNVPTDDRCRDHWIRGLPGNIPDDFIPRIKMPEGIERDTDRVAGACLKVLQDNYGKNILRNVLYNRMSDRAFDNEDWDRMVASVAECFAMFLDTSRRGNPDDQLEEAANRVIEFMAAMQIEQFDELGDALDDRAYNATKDALLAGLELAQDIDDWKRGNIRRSRNDRDDRSSRRGGRDDDRDYRGGRRSSRGGYQGNGTADYRSNDDRDDRGSSRGRTQSRGTGFGANGGGLSAAVALENDNVPVRRERGVRDEHSARNAVRITEQNSNELHDEDEFNMNDRGGTYTAKAEPTTTARGLLGKFKHDDSGDKGAQHFPKRSGARAEATAVAAVEDKWESDAILPHIQNTEERPMDRIKIDNEKVAILAHLSGLTKTYVFGEPERIVYDSYTHVHYHIVNIDGTVSNLYLELEKYPNMDYAALETNKAAEKKMMKDVAAAPRIKPNFDLLANMVNKNGSYLTSAPIVVRTEEEQAALDGLEELALAQDNVANVDNLPIPVMALSIAHGIALHDASVPLSEEDSAVNEYYVDVVTPFVGAVEFGGLIEDVINTKTLAEAIKKFAALKSNEQFPKQAWYNLHDQLTDRLVSFLNNEMSIRVKFDSIVDDWDSVVAGIEKHYSASAMEIIDTKVDEIFAAIISPLTGEDLDTFGASFSDLAEGKLLTAVSRRVAVSYSNWSSKDLGPGMGDGGVVLESATPQLYKSFTRLLERTEVSMEKFAQVLVVANDNKVYSLRRGAFNINHLILVPMSASILR